MNAKIIKRVITEVIKVKNSLLMYDSFNPLLKIFIKLSEKIDLYLNKFYLSLELIKFINHKKQ